MSLNTDDERWMRRALDLAERGRFATWPNPMVGCVVVENGQILGEGWHRRFGEAHAEVNALLAVPESADLRNATAYVTLEPCSHTGKTPPCADLLVRRGVGRVVMAIADPNPRVEGRGVERLRHAGIHVEVGCLEHDAVTLNRRFVHAMTQRHPWVTLKWAQSADGFMDPDKRASALRGGVTLTGTAARRHTHGLRASHDGILVGMNTWLVDAPSLTTRLVPGPNPKRFVLTRGETPCPAQFPSTESDMSSIALLHPSSARGSSALESWKAWGMDLVALDAPALTPAWWSEFREATGISACLVEGGAEVARTLLKHETWNELHVLQAPVTLENGLDAPVIDPATASQEAPIGSDVLYVWLNDMNHAYPLSYA